MRQAERISSIRKIAVSAILTALAVVLMYLEVPLFFFPGFLKFDFSELPVVIGAFVLGPVYGVIIELLKNLIHLPVTQTAGIGELSNFITGSIFVFTAGLVFKRTKTFKGAAIALIASSLVLTVLSYPINYFITLPLYSKVLGFTTEAIVGMCSAVNPLCKDKATCVLYAFVPFNLFKTVVISILSFALFKPVSLVVHLEKGKSKTKSSTQ